MTYYIYLHCKPDGTPFYVGKGSGKRAYSLKRRNKHHRSVVGKYGEKNIGVHVFHCETEKQAFEDEIQVIAQLRREGYSLANVTNGGEGVSGLSKPVSAAQRAVLSEKLKGNKNGLGYRHSPETLRRMSGAMKGQKLSKRMIERLRESNQKRVLCVDTGDTFESATEAAEYFGMRCRSSVTKCCRGEVKTAYGHSFQYQQ